MKISIITVCYNSEKTIEDTINSVLNQTYADFEYLIIDGKSKDNTINIVNKYVNDKRIKFLSEKDNGLYDAMNKGIKLATGDIIGIINSDDILYDNNVFQMIVDNYDNNTDILHGNVVYYDETLTNIKRDYVPGEKNKDYWCGAHPSMYIKKEVFDKVGLYNTNYRIVADYDFMIRCNISNIKYKYVNKYFVKMRYGGASNGLKGYYNNFRECVASLRSHNVKLPLIKTIIRTIKTLKAHVTK